MPHLTTGSRPVNVNTLIDKHYGSISDESRSRLKSTIEASNPSKMVDGTIRLPAIVVTPDDPAVPEPERRACESMAQGEACRVETRMGRQVIATLGGVMTQLGPAGVSALTAVGAWAQRHREDLTTVNGWVSGGNYGVTRRLGEFADALNDYETKLNSYILNRYSPGPTQMRYRTAALSAFRNVQGRFGGEMKMLARSPRYRSWVHNPFERFAGGMESSWRTNGGPISMLPETRMLKTALRATRFIGKGALVVDLVGRGARIATSDNRGYTVAREAASFLASMGGATLGYGTTLLALSILSGPGGLVAVIALAGGSAIGAVAGDQLNRVFFDAARSLSDLGGSKRGSGRARPGFRSFEANSRRYLTRRIGKMDRSPASTADSS